MNCNYIPESNLPNNQLRCYLCKICMELSDSCSFKKMVENTADSLS